MTKEVNKQKRTNDSQVRFVLSKPLRFSRNRQDCRTDWITSYQYKTTRGLPKKLQKECTHEFITAAMTTESSHTKQEVEHMETQTFR